MRHITGSELFEEKGFKEPRGVTEMPLGRAYIIDRLHYVVLDLKRGTDLLGSLSGFQKTTFQLISFHKPNLSSVLWGVQTLPPLDTVQEPRHNT